MINAYEDSEGRLGQIYGIVMLSDILVDDDRFRKIIDEEIAKGTIESYPAYAAETDDTRQDAKVAEQKRRDAFDKQAEKEAKEDPTSATSKAKTKGLKKSGGDMSDLAAMIKQRQQARAGNFFDNLEAKYAPRRGSKRATPMEEPPEEAFEANRKKPRASARTRKEKADLMGFDEEDIVDSEEEDSEATRNPKAKKYAKGRGKRKAKG